METENKNREIDKNRDKNPAGPSTSGGKAWPNGKYPNFFLRISYDNNNNILFPGNQAQFLPRCGTSTSQVFFVLFGELTTVFNSKLEARSRFSPPLLPDLSNMKVHL